MKELPSHDEAWAKSFRAIYDRSVEKYEAGERRAENLVTSDDAMFLASIGCTPQELYDFVEDWVAAEEPSFEVALGITDIRREYFLKEQYGQWAAHRMSMKAFPPKEAGLGGFTWLPRIITKAKARLRGELPPELMYNCGGDRWFLESIGADPVDFLRVIWEANDDDQKVLDYVNQKAERNSGGTRTPIRRFMTHARKVGKRVTRRILKTLPRRTIIT